MAQPVLSVVVPVYGEAEHLESSLREIRQRVAAAGVPFEIIAVDDGSLDATWAAIERLAVRLPELNGISLARNFGKEAAILAGLRASQGDAVVVIDGDLQHPPRLIPTMLECWRDEGYQVVNARKRRRGRESLSSRLAARLFYGVFGRLTGLPVADASDFKLLDRKVVDVYCELPERSLFFRGIVPWIGFRQLDIFFDVEARTIGRSKWSLLKRVRLAADAIVSFSALPLQLVTLSGTLFLAFAILLAGHTVYVKLSGGAIEGFTTVIVLILTVGSILMLGLGLMGQYLAKIFQEVKGRPRYVVRRAIRNNVDRASADDREPADDIARPFHAALVRRLADNRGEAGQ